ncbi:UNVERIFIED_CONTAM: hypothetical protein FKN15_071778 [Acipenser sinensis]
MQLMDEAVDSAISLLSALKIVSAIFRPAQSAPFKAQRHSQLGLCFHQKDCSNVTAELQLLHTGASQTMVTTATPHRVTTGSVYPDYEGRQVLWCGVFKIVKVPPLLQQIQTVPMAVLRSNTFYKQRWMVMMVDTAVTCPTDSFTNGTMAALAVKVESVPSLSPSQLTLRDPSCRPLQSDAINAVFYFNVNSCGTTRRFDNNLLTYENEVLFTSYRLRVACHYLVNDTKVVHFLYQNNPAPLVQPGLGDLAVIMRLALDSTYNDFYGARDCPVVKYLRRPLYFEVELLYSRDPQAELFLENCWATYSADRNSSPKWDVVVDSCENSADEYLTIFHPVSSNARVLFPSHLKRFEVKMFSFTSGRDALKGQIYFHCSVVICDSNRPSDGLCSRLCIPGKQRLGRSAEGMDGGAVKAFVSSGPIELKRDGSLRFMPRSGHSQYGVTQGPFTNSL